MSKPPRVNKPSLTKKPSRVRKTNPPDRQNRLKTGRPAAGGQPPSQTQATKLVLFNKPFNVLSQFTDAAQDSNSESGTAQRDTLAQYIELPNVYPAGRLDRDSEGLLLLTNDGTLQSTISHPSHKMQKTYLVQVDGQIDEMAIKALCSGVLLKDGPAKAITASLASQPSWLWERNPAVRFRKSIPTSWLQLNIDEGRNRQVRRMTAKVGFPTLRLIRTQVGNWSLGDLQPGQWKLTEDHS